ncbi:hypothetical protein AX774_g6236 [Zancudomyces culisetae]|uniref:Uncharacterized protein n=1 Tax=Zancudomyces culisetae TaxID=1213189 RepID=A0A1R1PEM0_ZANCU|nr:hypothetical protein AX774_g7178 [Zancudomyces culisetae]OMH80329.1 hypothetical protein AX774_g6236 [Zancudomyces culisetae]|eukprot:OMH79406.1 hypothetical protein AX774_g7178 [Zancudomyces culisetae]
MSLKSLLYRLIVLVFIQENQIFALDEIYEFAVSRELTSGSKYHSKELIKDGLTLLKPYERDATILGFKKISYENDKSHLHDSYYVIKETCTSTTNILVDHIIWYNRKESVLREREGYSCKCAFFDALRVLSYSTSMFVEKYFIQIEFCVDLNEIEINFSFVDTTHNSLSGPVQKNCAYSLFSPVRKA